MFAVVELKYDEGKMLAVAVDRIIGFKPKFNKTETFLCYWTSNMQDNVEELECGYALKFTGNPSLFKVFIIKLTDSIEEAENYLKESARPSKMPKRFRDPGNTDAEMKKIKAKKRRSNKKELGTLKAKAQAVNVEYLIKDIELQPSSTSMLNETHMEHTVTSDQEGCINNEKETAESPNPSMDHDIIASDSFELLNCVSYDEWIDKLMNDDSNTDEDIGEALPIISGTLKETNNTETVVPSTSCSIAVVSQSFDNGTIEIEPNLLAITAETIVEMSQPMDDTVTTNQTSAINSEYNIVVLNFDEVTKEKNDLIVELNVEKAEKEKLMQENSNLKADLRNADKRNLLLQNYLVEANERVPETLYMDKDGGRLYRDGVFLTKIQCSVLDKATTDREFLNNLVVCIFGKDVLRTHSITGKPCNKTKTPGKPKLDEKKLKLAYDILDSRSVVQKTEKLSLTKKNAIVGKKIANLCASGPTENNSNST